MPTKKKSASSSSTSGSSTRKRSALASDLIHGLEQAILHRTGQLELPTRTFSIPASPDIPSIRAKLGLSQAEFAAKYCFRLRTLQEWEQGRAQPDQAVTAYLTVIEHNPTAVAEALGSA